MAEEGATTELELRFAKTVAELDAVEPLWNSHSHRFYEREGFRQRFVVYYGKSPAAER